MLEVVMIGLVMLYKVYWFCESNLGYHLIKSISWVKRLILLFTFKSRTY